MGVVPAGRRISVVGVTLRQLEDKKQETMTPRKTLRTKPLTSCQTLSASDMILLAASFAETSRLLHQTCKALFALGASVGKRWDKDSQKWA